MFLLKQIMAHELGHNLGMYHDFLEPFSTPKTMYQDSNGINCTNVNGVMDYYVTVLRWTTCSVEKFTQHYNNVIYYYGKFCMPLNTQGTYLKIVYSLVKSRVSFLVGFPFENICNLFSET